MRLPPEVRQELPTVHDGNSVSGRGARAAWETYSNVRTTRSPLGCALRSTLTLQSIMDMMPSPNFSWMSALMGVPYTNTPWCAYERRHIGQGVTTYLEETVEERVLGRHRAEAAAREPVVSDLSSQVRRRNFQQVAKLRKLFVGGLGLPQRIESDGAP